LDIQDRYLATVNTRVIFLHEVEEELILPHLIPGVWALQNADLSLAVFLMYVIRSVVALRASIDRGV
jgi:hypothetical protein